ncbi:ferredoxin [Deltaproteobacteria bacterium Smac51]|nr:ferredoxin [Deltaproteobacteria bacterium Smac51]
MSSFKITFMPDNVVADASSGETIIDVANRANLHINASCGGAGVCGRCRVVLAGGEVESEPGVYLSSEEYGQGVRLACLSYVVGNATINIPPESRADATVYATAQAEEETSVETLDPMAKDIEVELTAPSAADNLGDYDRLMASLTTAHGLENPEMELAALLEMPEALRDGDFSAWVTLFEDPTRPGRKVIGIRSAKAPKQVYALAVDIGTTTVWGRLVNLETGESRHSHGDLNGQISFGEDVISRIVFAAKGDGLARLKDKVIANINNLIDLMEKDVPGCRESLALVVTAGNTTMSHLLTGLNPKSIRLSPYVPAAADWPVLKAADLGIKVKGSVPLLIYPSVSSYVGGDIVAGVLASGLYQRPELTLFIDVGTNGEIVVGNQDWMTCAACSAGPAFEGGGVKFGMRAAPGAIDQFYFDPVTRTHRLTTIGEEKAIGICGSGLINIVAELFMAGVLDPQGKYVKEKAPELIRDDEDGQEYVLCPAAETGIDRDIVLTEIDVDNLIRAKGAMYSGYQTLLESVGLTMGDLEKVIIGGGFGKSLNLRNAITIGLLPELPVEKFSYIGNSSLTGATLAALSGSLWQKAGEIKANMTNFELSETPGYMDYYMASQFLPHTRSDLFPETMAARAKGAGK